MHLFFSFYLFLNCLLVSVLFTKIRNAVVICLGHFFSFDLPPFSCCCILYTQPALHLSSILSLFFPYFVRFYFYFFFPSYRAFLFFSVCGVLSTGGLPRLFLLIFHCCFYFRVRWGEEGASRCAGP